MSYYQNHNNSYYYLGYNEKCTNILFQMNETDRNTSSPRMRYYDTSQITGKIFLVIQGHYNNTSGSGYGVISPTSGQLIYENLASNQTDAYHYMYIYQIDVTNVSHISWGWKWNNGGLNADSAVIIQ